VTVEQQKLKINSKTHFLDGNLPVRKSKIKYKNNKLAKHNRVSSQIKSLY